MDKLAGQGWQTSVKLNETQFCTFVTVSWPATSVAACNGGVTWQASVPRPLNSLSPTQTRQVAAFGDMRSAAVMVVLAAVTVWFHVAVKLSLMVLVAAPVVASMTPAGFSN